MGYGRLGSHSREDAASSSFSCSQERPPSSASNKRKIIFLSAFSLALIVASAVSATLLIGLKTRASGPRIPRKPTQAISRTCSRTLYPSLCIDSLMDFPGSLTASEQDLVHISFNMTLQRFSKALYYSSGITYLQMDPRVRSALDDCLELLGDSVDALSRSLGSVAQWPGNDNSNSNSNGNKREDVMTWLSAALTNQDTCTEGFEDLNGGVKDQLGEKLKDLAELVSNCLAIFSASDSDDFSGVPVQNRRRLLEDDISGKNENDGDVSALPKWLSREDRRLLTMPHVQADIIVSQDGNGTFKTISEAIKKAPENSDRRTIIYVTAGR